MSIKRVSNSLLWLCSTSGIFPTTKVNFVQPLFRVNYRKWENTIMQKCFGKFGLRFCKKQAEDTRVIASDF